MFCVIAPQSLPSGLFPIFILLGLFAGIKMFVDLWPREKRRERRKRYYRDEYLQSDDWKRKRALVLKRDRYKCVCFAARALHRFTTNDMRLKTSGESQSVGWLPCALVVTASSTINHSHCCPFKDHWRRARFAAGTTTTISPRVCATNSSWVQTSANIIAGHSYLTLLSHDDNYVGDATYTLFDDVSTQ